MVIYNIKLNSCVSPQTAVSQTARFRAIRLFRVEGDREDVSSPCHDTCCPFEGSLSASLRPAPHPRSGPWEALAASRGGWSPCRMSQHGLQSLLIPDPHPFPSVAAQPDLPRTGATGPEPLDLGRCVANTDLTPCSLASHSEGTATSHSQGFTDNSESPPSRVERWRDWRARPRARGVAQNCVLPAELCPPVPEGKPPSPVYSEVGPL